LLGQEKELFSQKISMSGCRPANISIDPNKKHKDGMGNPVDTSYQTSSKTDLFV